MNAAFQSMMWTPIVRLIAIHVRDENLRVRAQGVLALTLVIGHFGAWAISGFMARLVSWRFSFFAPAALTLTVGLISSLALRGLDVGGRSETARGADGAPASSSAMAAFTGTSKMFI